MLARSTGMRDYDTPKKPEDTPPVINPGAKQENSHDSGQDDSEEAPSSDRPAGSPPGAAEQAMAPAQEGGRDGAGEAALDHPSRD